MKQFLVNIVKLIFMTILVLVLALFFIPDKATENSILGALPTKHHLLESIKKPKLILLGGSNVSFGINSEMLYQAYKKPIVNMGVHAGLGLEFIINDIKPYIKKGDTIILMPEYEHLYTDNFYGEMELISVVFDIEPNSKKIITQNQWKHLLHYLPTYAAKKIKNYIPSLLHKPTKNIDIYSENSFNSFGDAYIHWNLPNQTYQPSSKVKHKLVNKEVISFLKDFQFYCQSIAATLILFPPVIDETSYNNQNLIITEIENQLQLNNISFVVPTNSYKYADSLFFNSYYHLNKKGLDKRTQQVINDLDSLKNE